MIVEYVEMIDEEGVEIVKQKRTCYNHQSKCVISHVLKSYIYKKEGYEVKLDVQIYR